KPERNPPETCRAYDAAGTEIDAELVPFSRSIASTALSLQEAHTINQLDQAAMDSSLDLQPFERGRLCLLAMPMAVAPGVQAVLELFDNARKEFTPTDQKLVAAAAEFGMEMLRQALAERQTQRLLVDAVEAALGASEHVARSLQGSAEERQ